MKVDNFALSQFDCPAKYDLRIRRQIVPIRRSAALSFGGVVHYGLAEWYRTFDVNKSLLAVVKHWPEVMPSDDFRTRDYAMKVIAAHALEYPSEVWTPVKGANGPLVEQAFTLDTGLLLECQVCLGGAVPTVDISDVVCSKCGSPRERILYGGIIDVGAEWSGTLYVIDHKTTTKLGKEDSTYYFLQYKPDNQMTGYIWGLRKLTNCRVGGAVINAIGLYKSGDVKFKRQLTARNDFEIAEWLEGVKAKCDAIKQCERTGFFRMETSQCMNYGQCEYHSIHVLNDPVSRQKRIEQDYVKSEWNYEERDD